MCSCVGLHLHEISHASCEISFALFIYYLNCVTLPNASHAIEKIHASRQTIATISTQQTEEKKNEERRNEKNAGKYKLPNCTRIWHIIHDLVVSHSVRSVRWWAHSRALSSVSECEL